MRRLATRALGRIHLMFLGSLAFAMLLIFIYQALWVVPGQRCEAAGNWWDPGTRICGRVVYLPDITHRPIARGMPYYPNLPRNLQQASEGASNAPPPRAQPAAAQPGKAPAPAARRP